MNRFEVIVTPGQSASSAGGRKVEEEVFFEAFGNTPALLKSEYDPYEHLTTFVTVYDHEKQQPAAASRVLIGNPHELKSVHDVTKEPWNQDLDSLLSIDLLNGAPLALDVATLAVSAPYRGGRTSGTVTMALYHGVLRYAKALQIDPLVAVFDVKVLNLVNRLFCKAWHPYPGVEALEYLGSAASMPAWCSSADLEARALTQKPELHEMIYGDDGQSEVTYPQWSNWSPLRAQ